MGRCHEYYHTISDDHLDPFASADATLSISPPCTPRILKSSPVEKIAWNLARSQLSGLKRLTTCCCHFSQGNRRGDGGVMQTSQTVIFSAHTHTGRFVMPSRQGPCLFKEMSSSHHSQVQQMVSMTVSTLTQRRHLSACSPTTSVLAGTRHVTYAAMYVVPITLIRTMQQSTNI